VRQPRLLLPLLLLLPLSLLLPLPLLRLVVMGVSALQLPYWQLVLLLLKCLSVLLLGLQV
jgi:hypothetical protein